MKPAVATLLALVVAACGTGTPATPPVTRTTQTPASTRFSTPTATGCRLPLWLYNTSTNIGTGYFLQVPGSGLAPAKPSVTSQNSYGAYVPSADRWVPVVRSLVAPDGKHYTYNDASGNPEVDRVHVVDVESGADHVIAQGGSDTGFLAFDFENDGVYAGRPSNGPGTAPGLWRLDPQTGAATLIEATRSWHWISGGYAYAVLPNPTDPVVVQGGPVADTLLRLDLQTRTVEQWFRKRGVFVNVLGFDWSGRPLPTLGGTLADLVVVTGQNNAAAIPDGSPDITFSYIQTSLVANPDGFWLGSDQGVYRYTAQGGFQQLWNNPTVKTVLPMVVGPCA